MKDLIIRSATIEDLPILLSFEQGIISTERAFDKYLKEDPISYYDIKEMILSPDSEVAVADFKGKVIASGFAQIKESLTYKTHNRYSSLRFMYVDSQFRGLGVNKSITDYLTSWSKGRNINHAILHVYSENSKAIKAYEKAGFKQSRIEMCLEF